MDRVWKVHRKINKDIPFLSTTMLNFSKNPHFIQNRLIHRFKLSKLSRSILPFSTFNHQSFISLLTSQLITELIVSMKMNLSIWASNLSSDHLPIQWFLLSCSNWNRMPYNLNFNNSKHMRIAKKLKGLVLKCDLFKTTEFLRYKGDS